jgi:hypothetical protein
MSVVASDIILYGAANMVEDDSSTVGGAIDKAIKVEISNALSSSSIIELFSSDAADTGNVTITGRLANGSIDTDIIALSGTTTVSGADTFERILKVTTSEHAGTISISGDSNVLSTMEGTGTAPGATSINTLRRLFYDSSAEASGGSDKELFEKIFVANTNSVTALSSATVTLTTDNTASGIIDFILEDAVNDSESTANRITAPTGTGGGGWSNAVRSVPGNSLGDRTTGTSDHVGIWLRADVDAGLPAEKATITLTIDGTTT